MALLELQRLRHELVRRADISATRGRVRVPEEQVAGEWDRVTQLAAEQVVHGHVESLADDVKAGELDRGVDLQAVVVQRRRGIADLEPERREIEHVVPDQPRPQRLDRQLSALAAAAQLPESDDSVGRLDLDDGPDEPPPVRARGMPERRLERHRDGRRPEVGNGEHGRRAMAMVVEHGHASSSGGSQEAPSAAGRARAPTAPRTPSRWASIRAAAGIASDRPVPAAAGPGRSSTRAVTLSCTKSSHHIAHVRIKSVTENVTEDA